MVAAKEKEQKDTIPPITDRPTAKAVGKVPVKPDDAPPADKTTVRVMKPRQARRIDVPAPRQEPDLVMVRAVERGQYGLDIDIIIRNPGEVFPMATSAMRKVEEVDGEYLLVQPTKIGKDSLSKREHAIEGATIIEGPKFGGYFELPGWVELVEEDEEIPEDSLVSHGHRKRWHQQIAADGTKTLDVL